jgi:hypothetical protein
MSKPLLRTTKRGSPLGQRAPALLGTGIDPGSDDSLDSRPMLLSIRQGIYVAVVLLLLAVPAHANDIADQDTLSAIESELHVVLEGLGEERRKPLAEQDFDRVTRLMRQLDGPRQRLGALEPTAPPLRSRKLTLESDLDRLTYLATEMWRALQAPELVAARRAKEEDVHRNMLTFAELEAQLAQIEAERARETQLPIGQQRRAVYERLVADASAILYEANRRWTEGEKQAQVLRSSAWQQMQRVNSDLYNVFVYEHSKQLEKEAEAKEQARKQEADRQEKARKQEAAAREEARSADIRSKGWSRVVQDAVLQRKVFLGMTPAQVRAAWGAPERINRTLTRSGEHEQWVYGLGQYLYFENGQLSSIQTSESPRR